ncbi:hypothetical protein C943_04132 [Mariniradius saccharolyticus AK6]|uniref:GIY-YIG domain-containing protein n=1 Tax=Mariniradius saccharolyticus AK6 TaxID=1239962 RepID=M7XH00_9BACT|nr:GIY-YIG nuclease family protein [Mariniradius saccharolyticus]EMS33813.1 hypothetical protein C943_04132 [Mariniradius saccharolyticus AK6]
MESSFVYILYSRRLDRYYTGVTTLSVVEQIENHIEKKYGKLNFTQKADDWELYHSIKCEGFAQARRIEMHIKKMKSKIYLQNLKSFPEMVDKLLAKYRNN